MCNSVAKYKHDDHDDDKINTNWYSLNFTREKFSQPYFFNIFHRQNFAFVFGLSLPLLIDPSENIISNKSISKAEKTKGDHHYRKSLVMHINFLVYI